MTICYSENTTECVGSSDQTCDGQEKKVVFYFESIGLIDDDDLGGGVRVRLLLFVSMPGLGLGG